MGNEIKLLEKPSKTSVKNDMRRLRDLGKKLISLTDGTLKNINLPDHIYVCIQIAKKMSSDEAKRRQISFLGKILKPYPTLQKYSLSARKRRSALKKNFKHQMLR